MKYATLSFAGVLALGLFGTAAHAENVTISGCVEKGVEAGCEIIKSGNKTYEIGSAFPHPKIGTYGTVTGSVFQGATICMQGTPLAQASWKQDPKKHCPVSK